VTSESARLAAGGPTDHWSIIKEQFTLRLALAHVGLGLVNTRAQGAK
jgi:hypothetical protein